MKLKKFFFILLIVLLFLHLTGCAINESTKTMSTNICELLEKEDITDITLKIYYMPQNIVTYAPLDIEPFVSICKRGNLNSHEIIIDGLQLEPYIHHLKEMDELNLSILSDEYFVNCRIYYILESRKNGILLEVVPRTDSAMLVNGVYVEDNELFYDFITPFLPEEAAIEWKVILLERFG